jgi:carboxyl-terminal processing protease
MWRARATSLQVRRTGERGRIGVVQLRVFTESIVSELARALKNEMQDARALIIDLRENGGGESEAMTDIASVFLPAKTMLGHFTDRSGRVQLEPQTRAAMLSSADSLINFRGSLVILSSTRTASAAEVFIAALKETGRARIIGENTCGCVLGLRRRHTLPDGGLLDISEMDFRTATGLRLEGIGIAPDELVTPTRRDLRANRDRALERAIEILKSEIKKRR